MATTLQHLYGRPRLTDAWTRSSGEDALALCCGVSHAEASFRGMFAAIGCKAPRIDARGLAGGSVGDSARSRAKLQLELLAQRRPMPPLVPNGTDARSGHRLRYCMQSAELSISSVTAEATRRDRLFELSPFEDHARMHGWCIAVRGGVPGKSGLDPCSRNRLMRSFASGLPRSGRGASSRVNS
jgi:hypothetical protein